MIFILYICLHKKRQNASCSFECENRVSTEKRQEMGEGRSESGQWRLLVINVPKRLKGLPPAGIDHQWRRVREKSMELISVTATRRTRAARRAKIITGSLPGT